MVMDRNGSFISDECYAFVSICVSCISEEGGLYLMVVYLPCVAQITTATQGRHRITPLF